MANIRYKLISSVINKSYALTDPNIHDTLEKRYEFRKQVVLADKSLSEDEKSEAIKHLNSSYDKDKIFFNEGTKRICENCQGECLATSYCELCVRNYLKNNFSNWTSGNDDIDNLIKQCQIETLVPNKVIEWIPYNKLQDIEYLTKGGFSEIYKATWIDGGYEEWDSKEQQLIRFGIQNVVLK